MRRLRRTPSTSGRRATSSASDLISLRGGARRRGRDVQDAADLWPLHDIQSASDPKWWQQTLQVLPCAVAAECGRAGA